MANTYVSFDGFIVHPKLVVPLTSRFEGTDRRAINGAALRSIKTVNDIRGFQIITERLDHATFNTFFNGLSYGAVIGFTDQGGTLREMLLMDKSATIVRSDPDVDGAEMGTGELWYEVSITLEAIS